MKNESNLFQKIQEVAAACLRSSRARDGDLADRRLAPNRLCRHRFLNGDHRLTTGKWILRARCFRR